MRLSGKYNKRVTKQWLEMGSWKFLSLCFIGLLYSLSFNPSLVAALVASGHKTQAFFMEVLAQFAYIFFPNVANHLCIFPHLHFPLYCLRHVCISPD